MEKCQDRTLTVKQSVFGLDGRKSAHYLGRSSGPLAQLVEQLTFNQWVAGSNPARLTTEIKYLAGKADYHLAILVSF